MRCGGASTRRRCAGSRASAGPSRRAGSRLRCWATGLRSTDPSSTFRVRADPVMGMVTPSADTPRRIAVLVEREGLGDVLLKLPLLRAITRGFPNHPVWWISTHQTDMAGPLRQFMPAALAEVREHARLGKPLREAAHRLREYPGFSLIFDTRSRIADVGLARHILAHEKFFCCLPGYFLSDARPPGRFTRPRHIGERALSLAQAALGTKADGRGELEATPAARDAAQIVLPEGPRYVGLGIGSRELRKNWPIAKFAELARALSARGMTPVLLLGPRE